MGTILTRMGDGAYVRMSEDELKKDVEEGTRDAAEKTGIQIRSSWPR